MRSVSPFLVSLLAMVLASPVSGQAEQGGAGRGDHEPGHASVTDTSSVALGRSLFRTHCATCHGIDARGGRGPDLTLGEFAHGETEADLVATIIGGVPGTEMPPADGLSEDEAVTIVAYLRSVGGAAEIVPGRAAAGAGIFCGKGACSRCHMVNGEGGRLGPDLSRIGSARTAAYLAESLRDPEKDVADGYQTVVAVTEQGRRIIGVGRNEDTFSLQMMDADEQLHLLLKRDLREVVYEPGSLMPRYDEDAIDERELQDLVAYLKSLRGPRTDPAAGGESR